MEGGGEGGERNEKEANCKQCQVLFRPLTRFILDKNHRTDRDLFH